MSPKTYGFLWTLVFIAAGIMWLAGVFTLLAGVVFGFIAFGMTFMGMMCVLPGAVSHPHAEAMVEEAEKPKTLRKSKKTAQERSGGYATLKSA